MGLSEVSVYTKVVMVNEPSSFIVIFDHACGTCAFTLNASLLTRRHNTLWMSQRQELCIPEGQTYTYATSTTRSAGD